MNSLMSFIPPWAKKEIFASMHSDLMRAERLDKRGNVRGEYLGRFSRVGSSFIAPSSNPHLWTSALFWVAELNT